jgi:hypothetical protein
MALWGSQQLLLPAAAARVVRSGNTGINNRNKREKAGFLSYSMPQLTYK